LIFILSIEPHFLRKNKKIMIKKFKPITPSQRHTAMLDKTIFKTKPSLPHLIKGLKRSNGRNNQGKITVRHRGGGHKRNYRLISFKRFNLSGEVTSIEYDPNRSANIAAIQPINKPAEYILAPENLILGQWIESGETCALLLGNCLPLTNIPLGTIVHNISLKSNKGGQLARSAGTYAKIINKTQTTAILELKSGIKQEIPLNCYATIGKVSNPDYKNQKLGKAGRSRWLNCRPKVRGVAKNPVDHPHGGGEGKTSGGRPSVSFTGRLTKGKPTRKKPRKKI
jgi:large subunit ribosomal protein L2